MLSLILTVFLVHVAIYLVNTIGAATIDGLVRSSRLSITLNQANSRPPAMAALPQTAERNLAESARTEPAEARGPRAETRHEQHKLAGRVREVGQAAAQA
jgi:hypothetical protein